MTIAHVLCAVDSFRITQEGHGVFGDELRIEGWFLSHAATTGMEILFDTGLPLSINLFRNDSAGVWMAHGEAFGDAARHCRFVAAHKVPDGRADFSSARLRVRMDDGNVFERALGAPALPEPKAVFLPTESALVMGFESIGDNCEFGLVQRRVGTERMSLFRYAGIFDPSRLAHAIRTRFAGFAEGDDLVITTFGPEWICDVRSASLNLHTGRIQGQITRERIEREERAKLQFLAGKFVDDVGDAAKILVYRTLRDGRGGPDGTAGMDEIYDAIAAIGSAPLLWVNEADAQHPHATVQHVRGRLYRGFIQRLCPYDDVHSGDDRGWIELLTAAREVIEGVRAERVMA